MRQFVIWLMLLPYMCPMTNAKPRLTQAENSQQHGSARNNRGPVCASGTRMNGRPQRFCILPSTFFLGLGVALVEPWWSLGGALRWLWGRIGVALGWLWGAYRLAINTH